MSRPGAPSSNDTPTSFVRRGAKGEERGEEEEASGTKRARGVGGWSRGRRRGREGEAASADCQAASERQRRSLPGIADEPTGDTKQTAALTSSERRR